MAMPGNLEREASEIYAVTRLGMIANSLLAIAKLVVGYFVGSLALIADGFNSLADMITDFAVLVGTALGAKPADSSHPYGHGKIETIVALIVELGIFGVGLGIIYTAITSLIAHPEIPSSGLAVVLISAITIVTKEILFRKTTLVADRCRSAALHAKAWDHRADVAVSVVVLCGGIGSIYGWVHADAIAGLGVGLVVIAVGTRLAFETLIELTEGSAGGNTHAQIDRLLESVPEVKGWHKLRTRRIGRELLMDVHILLDPHLTVESSHQIVRRIENLLATSLDWPINLTIHIDPNNDEIRARRLAAGDNTLR